MYEIEKTEKVSGNAVIGAALAFTVPKITYAKNIMLSFYAFDAQSASMKRKRIKLNHLGPKWFIRHREKEICGKFLSLLSKGWSPFDCNVTVTIGGESTVTVEPIPPKKAISICEAFNRYLIYIKGEVNREVMSSATLQTYSSYVRLFTASMNQELPITSVGITEMTCFIDSMKKNGKSPKFCNSFIGWLKTVFGWFVERGIVPSNPASSLKTETLARKEGRSVITEKEREELFRRLRNKGELTFLLACMMEYNCFIRPNELYRLKVGYLSFAEKSVFVPASISKNKKSAKVALPNCIIELMVEIGIGNKPSDFYLFGSKLNCCSQIGYAKQFLNFWSRHVVCEGGIMPELHGKTFYSFKNSGITDLLESGVPTVEVRDQARHQDISTTEIYNRKSRMTVPKVFG